MGLRPIINVSGTMTALGAAIIVPEASQAMAKIAPQLSKWTSSISPQARSSPF
ncbi:hypothetical protein [Mesorhizobium sp. WSM2239]|uniref:Uncharacterized protein n=2 Tax=unclassified Mesorhizobium TaxID=325217 RepID=A0AAU8DIK4_9HYPH